jgi:hypothetical protein
MKWFRHYHGLVTDPKLHRIASDLGVRRHVVGMAWCAVLEYGSDNSADRGSVAGLSAKTLAYMTDCSEAKAAGCLAAFRSTGMIDGDKIRAFSERNYDSDDAYKRVVKHRQRQNLNGIRSKNDRETIQSEANPIENQNRNALENNETCEKETFLVTVDETPHRQRQIHSKKEREENSTKEPANGTALALIAAPQPPAKPACEFDRFWQAYPRRVAKEAARKAWGSALSSAEPAAIVEGAERYSRRCGASGTEAKFIAHPATWLNAHRWIDEDPTPVETFAPKGSNGNGQANTVGQLRLKSFHALVEHGFFDHPDPGGRDDGDVIGEGRNSGGLLIGFNAGGNK